MVSPSTEMTEGGILFDRYRVRIFRLKQGYS